MTKEPLSEEKKSKVLKPEQETQAREAGGGELSGLAHLQNQVGNRAVQRLLAQRSGEGAFELDEETAGRINQARGGQPLDGAIQAQMGEAVGHDFSGVRVHTSPEADTLNQQLGAKAFTTGQDVFFREGAYDPHSGSGQELIAHELTHVVQQSSSASGGSGGKMQVNAPGDVYEQEADTVAQSLAKGSGETNSQAAVQRQLEESTVQREEEAVEEEPPAAAETQPVAQEELEEE